MGLSRWGLAWALCLVAVGMSSVGLDIVSQTLHWRVQPGTNVLSTVAGRASLLLDVIESIVS